MTLEKLGIAHRIDFAVGLDLGHRNVPAAERWIHRAVESLAGVPAAFVACTHPVSQPNPHVVISLVGRGAEGLPGADGRPLTAEDLLEETSPERCAAAAAAAAQDNAERRAGRAVIYPGVSGLTGTLRVEEILAVSAIDRVAVFDGSPLGSTDAAPDAKVTTRDYVRPHWSLGQLTLIVIPTAGGDLVPFEAPR